MVRLNGFDVPKLYMHRFSKPHLLHGKSYDYAIVDGRQRLEAMWAFIEGKFPLADDFSLLRDPKLKLGGMTYQELGAQHPELKADFDGFPLSVVLIETDDLEMIEEMFSRLNEAAPLTAPEKRNAYGGPIPAAVRKLANEPFFTVCLPFKNKRYRHFDLATKFLLCEKEGKIVDTKKVRLDAFVEAYSSDSRSKALPFVRPVLQTLESMKGVFTNADPLLKQVGMTTLYFHAFRVAKTAGWVDEISRGKLVQFEKKRLKNRQLYELGESKGVDLELVEFDGHAQSPNDSGAVRFRLRVLLKKCFGKPLPEEV